MFTPEKMCKIHVLVLSKHLNDMTGALGHSGLVHLIDAVSQSPQHLLNAVDLAQENRKISQMLERSETLLEAFGIERDADIPKIDPLELSEIEALLDNVFARYREQDIAISKLLRDADVISRDTNRFSEMPLQTVKLEALRNLSHFYMVTGRLRPDAFLRARQALDGKAIFIRDEAHIDKVLVLASRKSRWSVEDGLGKYGFEKIELPEDLEGTLVEKRQDMETQVDLIRTELDTCRLAMVRLGGQYGAILLAVRHQLHTYVAIQKAQSKFGHSSQLYCVSGWVPSSQLDQVRKIVDSASGGVAVLEATEADQDVDGSIRPGSGSGQVECRPFAPSLSDAGHQFFDTELQRVRSQHICRDHLCRDVRLYVWRCRSGWDAGVGWSLHAPVQAPTQPGHTRYRDVVDFLWSQRHGFWVVIR